MIDPERLLGDALQERASGTSPAPTDLASVVSTARGIRRHQRRRAALVAAVAAVAVVLPTALVLGQSGDRSLLPSGPPSVTDSSSPDNGLASLPRGPEPKVDYLDGTTYVGSAGARSRLPERRPITGVTAYHGGFLVSGACCFEGTVPMTQYDNRGREVGSWCSGGPPVVGDGGLLAAWVVERCPKATGFQPTTTMHRGIVTGMGEGETSQPVTAGSGEAFPLISLAGMWGEQVVYLDRAEAWVTDLVAPPRRVPGVTFVGGVDGTHGRVAGVLEDGTSAVVDLATGQVEWITTDFELSSFSPAGTYLVGLDPTGSGGFGYAVLDAGTGDVVTTLDLFGAGPKAVSHVWEDETHLLIDALGTDDTEAILRADLEGHLTLATPLRPRGPDPQYVFAARP